MENLLDEQIAKMFAIGESCVWFGKPQKKCHVLGAVLKMLPFALLWLALIGFGQASSSTAFSAAEAASGV